MTITSKSTNSKNESLGIALFLIGVLPTVLVAMLLVRPPLEGQDMTVLQTLASALVGAFGSAAVLIVSLAVSILGGWMFTGGAVSDPVRHLSGILALGAGVAVSLGAFDPLLGGNLGQQTGGRLAAVHPALGLLVGMGLGLGMAWNAWGVAGFFNRPLFEKGKNETRIDDVLSEAEADGVTEAETNALVPDEAALEHQEGLWMKSIDKNSAARSPYPEDVRLQGKIPVGVKPLVSPEDEQLARIARVTAQGESLANEPQTGVSDTDLASGASASHGIDSPQGAPDSLTIARLLSEEQGVQGTDASQPEAAHVLGQGAGLPIPSWEQPDLFGLEEPEVIVSVGEGAEEVAEEVEEGECEEEEGEYEDEQDGEEDEESEYEEEEEDDEEAESEEEEEDEDEEEAEYEEEAEEEDEEAEYEEEDEESEYEEEEEEDEEAEYEEEEDEACEDETGTEPSEDASSPVVLKPRKGKRKAKADSSPPTPDHSSEELLAVSGQLFLDEGRVAVSLLQRRFDLDFQAACEVLDGLQEAGLIGPYKGGQQRDILMTEEEWQSKVAAS